MAFTVYVILAFFIKKYVILILEQQTMTGPL